MTFKQFIQQFREYLGTDNPSSQTLNIEYVYAGGKTVAEKYEILLGVGRWGTSKDPIAHVGICCNNKGVDKLYSSHPYKSVTDLVMEPPQDLSKRWGNAFNDFHDLETLLGKVTLFVEDVSPDSCFGLIALLARLCGVDTTEVPKVWLDYVRRWEAGDVTTTGKAWDSWGALHNALGHGAFDTLPSLNDDERTEASAQSTKELITLAWLECLRLALHLQCECVEPDDLSSAPPTPELTRAKALLQIEYQHYLQSLDHSTCLQLSVPIPGPGKRRRLVDAYFVTEIKPQGSTKVFLRNDKEHTWLGNGFSLMSIYRPGLEGTGQDITVSVDPLSGIYLEELWQELEKLETERWKGNRPNDKPRQMVGYLREQGFNEPWWNNGGIYDLLAAPRLVNGNRGSKLDWEDVTNTLWRLYNPMRELSIDISDQQHPVVAHWPIPRSSEVASANQIQSLLLSPTIKRYFAALAANGGDITQIGIADLPPESSFDFVKLNGGYAVIHQNGVFLLNDWRTEELAIEDLTRAYKLTRERLRMTESTRETLDLLVQEMKLIVKGRRKGNEVALIEKLVLLRANIQQVLQKTRFTATNLDGKVFSETLERRWGIADKLEELYQTASELQEVISQFSDVRTNRLINRLALYGFPAALFAGFFGFVLNDIGEITSLQIGEHMIQLQYFGVHILGLVVYLVTVGLMMLGLRRLSFGKRSTQIDK